MSNFEYPWFPFMARDWLCDTKVLAMPYDIQGVYVRLLCFQWENGDLIDSVEAFAALVNVNREEFRSRFWPYLKPMFPVSYVGRRANKKLRRIRINTIKESKSLSRKRSRASRARWDKIIDDANIGFAQDSLSHKDRPEQGLASKCIATCSDSYSDEDDVRAQSSADVELRPTRSPPPPISNPLPPSGPPTADDGLPIHDPPIRWGEFISRWNELAAAEDLPKIGGALSEGRKRKARAVTEAMRKRGLDWFEVIAGAVRDRRGAWARERRFPTLDQACREEIVDKLAEGFYEHDHQASSGPEHLNRQSDFKATKGPTRVKIIRPEDRR